LGDNNFNDKQALGLQTQWTMESFKEGWYLIYTKPRHERRVAEQLQEKQINVFFPTMTRVKQWSDRKKVMQEPMFPSYVFVFLQDLKMHYYSLGTFGFLKYVKFGKDVARVPEKVIDSLKVLASHEQEVEVTETHIHAGQKVVVQKGPLTGLEGEVLKHNGKHKILVRVSLLMRNVLVDISPEHLLLSLS
jgi:transcriptional antiterminator RfaH